MPSKLIEFEVINSGVSAYSLLFEYLYLKNYGLQFNPDLVILFTDLNDESDDVKYTAIARFDEKGVPILSHPARNLLFARVRCR